MIVKGKNKSEIARKLGISKQAFSQRINRCPESLYMNDSGEICYDSEIDSNRVHKKSGRKPMSANYDPSFTGPFITRKEYSQKYHVHCNYIGVKIANKQLYTTQDGEFVSDIPYKNSQRIL